MSEQTAHAKAVVANGLMAQEGDKLKLTEKGAAWVQYWARKQGERVARMNSYDETYPDTRPSNLGKLRKQRARRRAKNKVAKQSRKVNR